MVRFTVVCAFCLALALPAAADEGPSGMLQGLWDDLVAVIAEAIQPAEVDSGSSAEAAEAPATEGELWPTFIPNG